MPCGRPAGTGIPGIGGRPAIPKGGGGMPEEVLISLSTDEGIRQAYLLGMEMAEVHEHRDFDRA